ncbi:VOC family protein [uncultured Imperialibacter sp.]|uniref:VOC family protein n=1 Tax=uncultured Imperialibacter sp. TaxID=1672639 RepID=UPI0030DDC999|tara:strand:+ start:564 stop:935 length:372 start_codon:yes stop_codon:yes gene_type:complete
MQDQKIGHIVHFDLTVEDHEGVSEFYKEVVGWEKQGLDMGGYNDYVMKDKEGNFLSGVCKKAGGNANLPPYWLIYVKVEDLDASLAKCEELGGKVIGEKRKYGEETEYCLIQDPAGAYMMLMN